VAGEVAEINRIPAEQIAYYILHSGVTWGILTNGRRWRLYHKDTAQKQDRFYEVDLKELCDARNLEAFLYFYAFFRRAAFESQAPNSAASSLDLTLEAMLAESVDYALGVSESLKVQVFDALRHLAQGFLDYQPNGLTLEKPMLAEIYANSLTVLYRLLFVLYAEARELLPLRTSALYREEYSLYAIVREAAKRIDSGMPLLQDSTRTWAKLKDLFRIIDAGSPPLQVATFNGGLFDQARHSFLERNTVGDGHLQLALEQLARVQGEFIDYRDLAERHLGTIYEGLLEHHLDLLTAPVQEQRLMWTVDLFNDKGERHRTGSYYTPDYIVQYIVDQALRPILDAAAAGKANDADKVEAIFDINVVDPSMGSGHFLVAATDYIAHYLVDLGLSPGAEARGEADLAYWRRRVAQSCVYGVDINPLAVELAKLSLWLTTAAKDRPLSFLDHHLRCGNALVGAQVAAIDGEVPHVRGSSAKKGPKSRTQREQDASENEGQLSLLGDSGFAGAVSTAVSSMWLIEGSAGDTVADVKTQERLYEEVRKKLVARYTVYADLKTAEALGERIERKLWKPLAEYAVQREKGAFATPQFMKPLAAVEALAQRERFFHWDLEFPEVFFDRFGRPRGPDAGFDAVIGNPPYVRAEQLGPIKSYLAAAYPNTYHGSADLYVYFYDQGLQLLRAAGRMSYIVTNKWLRAGYGEGLRGLFAEQALVERIVDFGHAPIFADADVFPCIIVVRKPTTGDPISKQQVHVTAFPRRKLGDAPISNYISENSYSIAQSGLSRASWSLEPADIEMLLQKINARGVPLSEYAGVRPLVGIKTGLNSAFMINDQLKASLVSTHPDLDQHIKPYLRGRDIKRWVPSWEGLWILVLKSSNDYQWPWSGLPIDQAESKLKALYPALHAHMERYRAQLQARTDQGMYWWELRSCSYYDIFEGVNVFYQDLAFHSRFCVAGSGTIAEMTCFCLPYYDPWLLTVLNSPLMWSYLWRRTIHGKDEVLRLKTLYVANLPIVSPLETQLDSTHVSVLRLVDIIENQKQSRNILRDWLQNEFGLTELSTDLMSFWTLNDNEFVVEVQKRRPKGSRKLTPNALKTLRAGYAELATPLLAQLQEAQALERRLAILVNEAYGLTRAEVDLLWRTAPPRMPAA
jgi:type I restriction-modification system DNA methylase subunit